MKSKEEIEAAIKAQQEYCTKNKLPQFAPPSGICWSCRRQIYEVESGNSLVTGCPHCHWSYCD